MYVHCTVNVFALTDSTDYLKTKIYRLWINNIVFGQHLSEKIKRLYFSLYSKLKSCRFFVLI